MQKSNYVYAALPCTLLCHLLFSRLANQKPYTNISNIMLKWHAKISLGVMRCLCVSNYYIDEFILISLHSTAAALSQLINMHLAKCTTKYTFSFVLY